MLITKTPRYYGLLKMLEIREYFKWILKSNLYIVNTLLKYNFERYYVSDMYEYIHDNSKHWGCYIKGLSEYRFQRDEFDNIIFCNAEHKLRFWHFIL